MAGKEKKNIVIIVSGGCVQQVQNIPDDVMVSVRDYDVNEMYGDVKPDEYGDLYQEQIWNPGFEKKIIREPEYDHETGMRISPPILQCFCGNEVELYGFTNTCERCGADFNSAGQHLAPREQWGEETGEHLADILMIQ